MTLRHLLLSLGALGLAMTSAVGVVGGWGLSAVGLTMDETVVATQATQHATMGDMAHDALRGDVYRALMAAQTQSTDDLQKAQADATEHAKDFQARLQSLKALPLPDHIQQAIVALEPVVGAYTRMGLDMVTQARTDLPMALGQLPDFTAQFDRLEQEQDKVVEQIEAFAQSRQQQGHQQRQRAQAWMLTVTLLGGLLLFSALSLVARHVLKTLGDEPEALRVRLMKIAHGDLSDDGSQLHVDADSVVGSVVHMTRQLSHTVQHVRQNADIVANASSEVSSGSLDLANRTQEQASALERSVSALAQLSGAVSQNADSALQANQLAQGASQVATQGGDVVDQLVHTMQDIHRSSQKIADIITVIDGIAFQTNILALNAAVEAARAGEQGRGFAVVAGEVRTLAQRSANAAKEIKSLITDSVERVTVGASQADQAGETMKHIVESIEQVTSLMGDISRATREQTAGLHQVANVVNHMDQNTQANAALVEETATAASSLKQQAAELAQAVAVFRVAQLIEPVQTSTLA